ncbi:carbohydrate-binding protein [Kutzneria sp. NPDC051319]|uniref:carbohydrate-binding protein n=1 Tax=Kutzneria sp. NPDC051319 TaxID=3155047 RepID=UPI003437266D
MDPLDPEPPGGDSHRHDRLLVWAATVGALGCSALIFLATNSFFDADPVAEPAPTTALPLAASSTITTTTTTTTTPPPTTTTTTTATPMSTTPRHITTTTRTTTTTHAVTTTTTTPRPTTTHRCVTTEWRRDTAYEGGSIVAYNGHLWVAKWWNYNAVPGANQEGVWQFARDC